jgi:ubiquinone/menaquinone biosynthesis C-methylase UbiE
MRLIANIANKLRNVIEKKDEIMEPSGGFLSYRIREKAVSLIESDGRLLDIGAGEGLLLKIFESDTSKKFYGIDLDKGWLKRASERCPNKKRSLFILGDGRYLPFKSDVFDEVTILNLFMNIPSKKVVLSFLQESLRVCNDQGKVIFDYRNIMNPWVFTSYKTVRLHDPDIKLPLRAFTRREIKGILRSLGIRRGIAYYPIPKWWKINSPAYVVKIQKGGYDGCQP